MRANDYRSLLAYRKAFELAMTIFEISKTFPKEERYSLTDQLRRSSRSTCAQIAEAYRKRQYPKHFLSKLSDGDSENAETMVWLEFAYHCAYTDEKTHHHLLNCAEEVGRLIGNMIHQPEKFGVKV